MTIVHSEKCFTAQVAYAEYTAAHPNHCRTCSGTGEVWQEGDIVDYGSTTTHLPGETDVCSECIEVCKCPQCGTEIADFGEDEQEFLKTFTCPVCQWKHGDGAPIFECECWVEDETSHAEVSAYFATPQVRVDDEVEPEEEDEQGTEPVNPYFMWISG